MAASALRAASVAFLPGCVLVTGSTAGYRLPDAAACGGDAACAVPCLSAAECVGEALAEAGTPGPDASASGVTLDAGNAPPVCCFDFAAGSTTGQCSAAPCAGSPAVQLCATDPECGAGTSCVAQMCSAEGSSATIHACGLLPSCTPTSA
jgi:hypothetical protein